MRERDYKSVLFLSLDFRKKCRNQNLTFRIRCRQVCGLYKFENIIDVPKDVGVGATGRVPVYRAALAARRKSKYNVSGLTGATEKGSCCKAKRIINLRYREHGQL